ncbi:MAG: DUF294 nucleotidyltransferase-like domain-containing protein [Azospirillaceae bacterium]
MSRSGDGNFAGGVDGFAYRHRLGELMTSDPVVLPPETPLAEAVALMNARRISSVLVGGDRQHPEAIVTERDVLRAVAASGGEALGRPLGAVGSGPLESLPATALIFQAIGRMDRLGIRHLVVTGEGGAVVGIITARTLLKVRAGARLAIGDGLAAAPDAQTMRRLRDQLPDLAAALLAEDLSAREVAGVISEIMRQTTRRAAELALSETIRAHGAAPARHAVLVLGSGGRGESLLAPDQDNALIHDGTPADDAWFAAFGERMNALLDAAGVPFCQGGVMARNKTWRHDVAGWRGQVDAWIAKQAPEDLLNVDIFFDLAVVEGDETLATALRGHAVGRAAEAFDFLKLMSLEVERYQPPLGLLGGLRLSEGRLDLKIAGLFPIVAGARTMALAHGIGATATAERLAALRERDAIGREDAEVLAASQELFMRLIVRQQIADIAAGRAAGNTVGTEVMAPERGRLKAALRRLRDIGAMVRDGVASGFR